MSLADQRPASISGPIIAWSAVFVGALALAAIVSPMVFAAIKGMAPEAGLTLSRVFNRCAMLAAIGLMIACRRHMGWSELGRLLHRRSRGARVREVGAGFAVAVVAVAVGVGWAMLTHRIGPTLNEFHFFAGRTVTTFVGGLAAGLIEESFFRGLMVASLTSSIGWLAAAFTSSVAYSAVHLLSSYRSFPWHGYAVGAGFAYLSDAVGRQLEPESLPVLLGLFLGGTVLAVVVRTTGSLYLVIGLHAGWVFCFQLLRHATRVLAEIPGTSYLATHHYLVGTGWAWTAMLLSGLIVVSGHRLVASPSGGGELPAPGVGHSGS